jgi:Tol biopolymer transport system component
VVGKTYQPFWIIYWQGNEVWRVDDTGQERELLVDTFKELGQWLTDIPDPYKNSDCCQIGPRLVLSPDRMKLALVVVDRIQGTRDDKFTFSIFTFDINAHELKYLAEGLQPVWSLDGKHIAFHNGRTLWTADLDSGQVNEIDISHENVDEHVSEYAWSPDGEYLAYTYDFSMQRLPEIWLVKPTDNSEPRELLSLDPSISIFGLTWAPDGQSILFLSPEGSRDIRYHYNLDLWSVSVLTGERKQLTHDMEVRGFGALSEKKWLFITGFFPYERSVPNHDRDLWLLNLETNDLLRITYGQGDLAIAGVIPDDIRLVVWRPKFPPLILSLIDGSSTSLDLDMDTSFIVGGLK